ncbi:enoyl-CoA hydratase-related protein [Oceanibaculum nanhaiense]|uniref:enoyl-CoA hydratase-related protein n=1 Tax=Oceanibaculum nanhaiense TaxID=1909734 RepID=UPI003D298A29
MGYSEIAALIGLVGKTNALEILYEARVFGAAEAKEKGLVNRVVPDAEIDTAVAESVSRIVDGAAAGPTAGTRNLPAGLGNRKTPDRSGDRGRLCRLRHSRTSRPATRPSWPRPSRNSGGPIGNIHGCLRGP